MKTLHLQWCSHRVDTSKVAGTRKGNLSIRPYILKKKK